MTWLAGLVLLSAASLQVEAVPAARQANLVAVLPVHGEIDRVTQRSLERRLQEATRLGASSLLTWASSAVVMALQSSGFSRQTEVARIGVPVASAISSEEVAQMSWWFMSGDTDFL